ncbi:DUF4097 domain-containing protein [Colwelliaceae bacterium 6441]
MRNFIKICGAMFVGIALQSVAGDKVNETLGVGDEKNVSVENLRGKVSIIGWDKNEVTVSGEIDDKAENFIFEKDGSYIKIKVLMPHNLNGSWNDQGSDLMIKVPQNMRVDFTGVSTDITIEHMAKSTEIKSVSGNVTIDSLSQLVEVTSVSGDINSKNLSGKLNLSTVSGDIRDRQSTGRLTLKAVSGSLKTDSKAKEVSVNTVSGEIDLSLADVDELTISTVSGDVDGSLSLNDSGLVKMSSVSGDLSLTFENDVQASFRMKSNASGDLINHITDEEAKHAKYGPSSKLEFQTGNGKASVKASTVSGRVKVSKK